TTLRHMWGNGEQYLRKMGGIILVASAIVWVLNYFPRHDDESSPAGVETEEISDSDTYLQRMGKAINPVMEPLGFNWRATVAAIAGVPAKEIVVSTLGVLYTGEEDVATHTLSQRLRDINPVTGHPDFTGAIALSFMVFVLLYCPCIATITAIVKETGNPRYGLFSILYNTLVAWLAAFAVYHIALLF
ncbi:MAG: ferrous iron transport protein B, partial [Duncaniella sp.]|nr:ferrous iron transport protein B [Duncaniella sp.]